MNTSPQSRAASFFSHRVHAQIQVRAASGLLGSALITCKKPVNQFGFSLVELLVVVGIISLLLGLMGPVLHTLIGRGDLNKATGDIQGLFEQARSYALANNTYVYVGIQEVDALSPTANNGVGRIALAAVASLTGQRPYGTPPNPNAPAALTASNITPLGPVHIFDNIHITNTASVNGGGMSKRPTNAVLDISSVNAKTSFTWPLSGAPKYNFSSLVIEFNPQGIVSVQTNSTYNSTLNNYLELALLPSHGNVASSNANQAAIQISGITGGVIVYRP